MAHPLQPVYDFIMRRKLARLRKTEPELANSFDPKYLTAEMKEGRIDITAIFQNSPLRILGDEAARILDETSTKNFLELNMFSVKTARPVRITLQWAEKYSPGEECERLRRKVAELEAKVAEADKAWTEVFKLREQIEAGQLKPWER
jgi:hypothetical protein